MPGPIWVAVGWVLLPFSLSAPGTSLELRENGLAYVRGSPKFPNFPFLCPDLCGGDDCQYRLSGTFPTEYFRACLAPYLPAIPAITPA